MKTTIRTLAISLLVGLGVVASPAVAVNDAPWSGHCWKSGNYSYTIDARGGGTVEVTLGSDAPARPNYWVHRCSDDGVRYDVMRANTAVEVDGLRAVVHSSNKGPGVPYLLCRTGADTAYMVSWSWYWHDITERPGERAAYDAWAKSWKRDHGCTGARQHHALG